MLATILRYDCVVRAAVFLLVLVVVFAAALWPQNTDTVWSCPMDPDIRQTSPGMCRRCGMTLRSGFNEMVEYHMDLTTAPRRLQPGQQVSLTFRVHDPRNGRQVTNFDPVHEKLFHMFVISEDLEFFLHDHPVFTPDGDFRYDNLNLQRPGMYRILGDFYPTAATPQLIPATITVPGKRPAPVNLTRDYSAKTDKNLEVELTTDPPQAIVGLKTHLHFHIKPDDGFEKYLGAWGHMLCASQDLITLVHTHPVIADGGPEIQFDLNFPRPTKYRVWVQFQRKGVVNTAHFDIPVEELKYAP
jgi:hypothetical protein